MVRDFDAAMRAFFSASREHKVAVGRSATNSRGYFDDELTKQTPDWKECLDVGQPWGSAIDGVNQWPTGPGLEQFRPAIERYYEACRELAETLLCVCAVGLGLPQNYFDKEMRSGKGHTSYIRLNHYPPCPDPAPSEWGTGEPPPGVGHLGINKVSEDRCMRPGEGGWSIAARAMHLPEFFFLFFSKFVQPIPSCWIVHCSL